MTYRKLQVFLCHSSQDKLLVRELNQKLIGESWIAPWLDEEKLLAGQDWDIEIEKAVEAADAVIVCLSNNSVNKEGYVQKELRGVINVALEKPPETIFIIPLRLDECSIPRSIKHIHYFDYFPPEKITTTYRRLLSSLETRANLLGINIEEIKEQVQKETEEKNQRELVERIRKEAREKARHEEEKILRQEAEERARIEIRDEIYKLIEEGKRKEAVEKERREKELIQKKADELYKHEMELLSHKRAEKEKEERKKHERGPNEIDYLLSSETPKNRTSVIIGIATLAIILTCCITSVVGWQYGDNISQWLGL